MKKKSQRKTTSIYKDNSGCLHFSLNHSIYTSLINYCFSSYFVCVKYTQNLRGFLRDPFHSKTSSLHFRKSPIIYRYFAGKHSDVQLFSSMSQEISCQKRLYHIHDSSSFPSGSEYKKVPIQDKASIYHLKSRHQSTNSIQASMYRLNSRHQS